MLDPGSFIAIALVSYSGAVKAWTTFRTAAHFSEDSDELVLKLSLERFRFETWGRNAGLEQNTFHSSLFPVIDLVTKVLDRIRILFENADELRNRYGLQIDDKSDAIPKATERFISRMQHSIRSTAVRFELSDRVESECVKAKNQAPPVLKLQWGIRDREKFQKLIEAIEGYIGKLNQLLTESQRRALVEDQARTNIAIVGSITDENSLGVMRKAIDIGTPDSSISNLVERKALSGPAWERRDVDRVQKPKLMNLQLLQLKDFEIEEDGYLPRRFLARRISQPGDLLLFERKDYPHESSSSREATVEQRVERLVLLLSRATQDLHTLRAVGYIGDRSKSCWWLVFQFPYHPPEAGPISTSLQPVSLLALLNPKILKRKPALEKRLELASQLAGTVSGLYSSSWMHKSLRSDNLLFPFTYDTKSTALLSGVEVLQTPLLAGFEFSRQDNESRSLDALKSGDISSVIYRHPLYQGEAASGYRIEYDIYSLGLMLVEIGFWQPLESFLDARVTKSTSDIKRSLSSKAETFHQRDAEELQKRVLYRVDSELAFRVGSVYRDVVRWCLTMADEAHARLVEDHVRGNVAGRVEWHPALEFYNKVVVPLSQYSMKGAV